jgi:hypothetical protein
MKKIISLLFLVFPLAFTGFSQCVPDAAGCPDVGAPGEICPAILPEGTQGQTYSQSITIYPPATAEVGGVPLNLFQIELLSVTNLPSGMTYASNQADNIFLVNNYYCVLLSGTPADTGTFPLRITVMPYLSVFGVPVSTFTEVVDSTSVTLQVSPQGNGIPRTETGFCWSNGSCFTPNLPGGFEAPKPEKVQLQVFNSLGHEIYFQEMFCQTGENYLPRELANLGRGLYFVSLTNSRGKLSRQWFKSE